MQKYFSQIVINLFFIIAATLLILTTSVPVFAGGSSSSFTKDKDVSLGITQATNWGNGGSGYQTTSTYSASGGGWGYSTTKIDPYHSDGGGGGTWVTRPNFLSDQPPLGDINNPIPGYGNGQVDSCDVISGWSCDRDFKDQSVVVQIKSDGNLLAVISANRPSPGLLDPPWNSAQSAWGKGCGPSSVARWDFRFPTPAWMKDGFRRNIQVFANNIGPLGAGLNVKLPFAPWSPAGKNIPVQCNPVTDIDLAATMGAISNQAEGVPFSVNSVKAANEGGKDANLSIPVVLQFDKKNGTDVYAWKYEGNSVNGDVKKQVNIKAGLIKGANQVVAFSNITLPKGEYRVKVVVDPGFTVEPASTNHQANNSSQWNYFTVAEAPPAIGNFETVSATDCTLSGWAYDPSNQGTSIQVRVYQGGAAGSGGTFVTACNANTARPDLITKLGLTNGNHSFICALPESFKDGVNRNYYIHAIDIDGSPNNVIAGSPKSLKCSNLPPKLILCPDPAPSLSENQTTQLQAKYWPGIGRTPTCSDPGFTDVTNSSVWSSSDPSNVAISNKGLATGVSWGSSNIKATYNGLSDSTTFTIKPLPPQITLTPASSLIRYGDTGKLVLSIKADYKMICKVTGASGTPTNINHPGTSATPQTYKITTTALTSKQTITVKCSVNQAGLSGIDAIEKTQIIEVVPKAQEV